MTLLCASQNPCKLLTDGLRKQRPGEYSALPSDTDREERGGPEPKPPAYLVSAHQAAHALCTGALCPMQERGLQEALFAW